MATLAAPSPVAGSTGNFDADLGSTLSAAYDQAVEETPGGEGGSADQPQTDPEEAPGGEGPAGPPPSGADPALPTEQAQPGAASEPYKLTEDGSSYLVPKADLPALRAAQQFHSAVSQWFGSPQEAQGAYQQSADYQMMSNDWISGSPDGIRGMMAHWAGENVQDPAIRARCQQSFSQMATAVPEMLQKLAPQAYEGFEQGILQKAIEARWQRAAETGRPEDLKEAQSFEWGITGDYRKEAPQARTQETALAAREREFNERQGAALQRDLGAFNNTQIEGMKYQALNTEIDRVLAPLKARMSETQYADLRLGAQRELIDTLQKQTEWWTLHQQTWQGLVDDYRTTWQKGSPGAGLQPRIQQYVNSFLQKSRQLLPSIAKKRLDSSSTRQTTPRGAPSRPAQTAPSGAPPLNGKAPNGRMPGEQWDKEWAQVFEPFRH